MPLLSEILEENCSQAKCNNKRSRKKRSSSKNNNWKPSRDSSHADKNTHKKQESTNKSFHQGRALIYPIDTEKSSKDINTGEIIESNKKVCLCRDDNCNCCEKSIESSRIKEASFVIQNEKKEATRSVANKFEVVKISDKDGTEIPLYSPGLSEQEKQRNLDVQTGTKNIEDLRLQSYSKNELIKIIEFSLVSYVEGLKQIDVNHSITEKASSCNTITDSRDKSLLENIGTATDSKPDQDLPLPSTNHVPCSKKELKKQRQREQRQNQPNKDLPATNMANPSGSSQTGKGWDRLVNPVQELGRSLLNFLVGGNNSNSTPSSNRRNSSHNDESLEQQTNQTKPTKTDVPQSLDINTPIKQSSPIVLRRSQQTTNSKAASFGEDHVQNLQSTSYSSQISIPDKRHSDLVAFAVQDNSAAVHSPPVLVPPNANRRKKRKDKSDIKSNIPNKSIITELSNKNPLTDNSLRQDIVSSIVGNDNTEIDNGTSTNLLPLSSDKASDQNTEENATVPRISFSNIIHRLSRSDDLEDEKCDLQPEKEHCLDDQNTDLVDIPDTPKPSFRKIQERLKSSEDSPRKEIKLSSDTLNKDCNIQNKVVDTTDIDIVRDSVQLGEEISENVGESKSNDEYPIKEELDVSNLPSHELRKSDSNVSEDVIEVESNSQQNHPNDLVLTKEEEVFVVPPLDQNINNDLSFPDTSTENDVDVDIVTIPDGTELPNKTFLENKLDVTTNNDNLQISVNESEVQHSAETANYSLQESNAKEVKDNNCDSIVVGKQKYDFRDKLVIRSKTVDFELLSLKQDADNIKVNFDPDVDYSCEETLPQPKVPQNITLPNEECVPKTCEEVVEDVLEEANEENKITQDAMSIGDNVEDVGILSDIEKCSEYSKQEYPIQIEINELENNTTSAPKECNVEELRNDCNEENKETIAFQNSKIETGCNIPLPPPPPPPGYLMSLSEGKEQNDVNDSKKNNKKKTDSAEKPKVNPAEVAVLKQLDSIQDPMFVNFLKANLNSSNSISRDKNGNAKEDKCEPGLARRHRKSRRISENEKLPHIQEQNSSEEYKISEGDRRLSLQQTVLNENESSTILETTSSTEENDKDKSLLENNTIASNSVNNSTEKCHTGEVTQLQDDSQHKTEYITDKEKQTENLTSTHASSVERKVKECDNPCEEISTSSETTLSYKKHSYEDTPISNSHDSINTNIFDSNSYQQQKEGVNDYCGKNCDNSSILHASTTENRGNQNLPDQSVCDTNSKMKVSTTNEDKTKDTSSTSDENVMSSITQQITEIIDKPAADIIDKKSQCKPLSKSDSGFSEKNLAAMNGKEASENTMTSSILPSEPGLPSEECEEEDDDSTEDNEEVKPKKEISADQAHKLFDRRYGAELAISAVSSDLKHEFVEAGATSPLERSIKKLRRLNSVNVKESKKVSIPRKHPEYMTDDDDDDDDYEDEYYSDEDDDNSQEAVRLRATRGGSADPRTFSSRRSSTDSSESNDFNINVRDLKNELKELEEKFRKAMVANAGLDNEKSALNYQVELLKDQMEEVEEQASLVNKELRQKSSEYSVLQRSHAETQRAVQLLQAQLDEQARLLSERGMVLVGNEDEETTCEDEDRANANGGMNYEEQEKRTRAIVSSETASILGALGLKGQPLDVRIRKLADERDDLGDTVRRLKMDLEEERQRNSRLEKIAPHPMSPEETEWETKKAIDDYKFKLQKSEQDINTLQTNVARLDSQVIRFKTAAETAERSEEELKTERRKMQRELREATTRAEELETANKHLETRLGKLKNAKSTLLKEL